MSDSKRLWTEHDIAKLKDLAGKLRAKEVAAEIGRTPAATAVVTSKLKRSLRRDPSKPRTGIDDVAAPINP